jgi:caspase domain-containing protein
MRQLVLVLAMIMLTCQLQAQNDEVTTEQFYVDFTTEPMEVLWLFPSELDSLIDYKDIVLKVGYNTKYDIKDLSLLLNGLPLATDHRGKGFSMKLHPDYDESIEQNVTLHEGGNVLKFAIRDAEGNVFVSEKTIVVSTKDSVDMLNRTDYAVLFATDEYDEWNNLVNPINDVEAIALELEENYGFKVEINRNFNKDEVIIKLREYAKKSYWEHDQLFIFFAGHGQFDELMGQGYIVCKDSKLNDEAKSSYIPHSVLRTTIDNIPSNHTLLAMDVCFGGTFDPIIARSGTRGNENIYDEIATNEYIKRKLRFKTRKYITSAGKKYVPDGRPGMHSPFASKFLEGLRSYGGRDDIVTLQELYLWLERINPEPMAGSFGSNEPGSDFVFVYNGTK